jgi:TatD DNase family protein
MTVLPFDAHNHVQLSPTPVSRNNDLLQQSLCGMAVMSTHPRDFSDVLNMSSHQDHNNDNDNDDNNKFHVVPCLGVHPWFLHELDEQEWDMTTICHDDDDDGDATTTTLHVPQWVSNMDTLLQQHAHAVVGEIGLDKFHFDPITKDLTSPMERQIEAFRYQLQLAIQHQRPVSIHCVRAMGPLMDTLQQVHQSSGGTLPPKLYFHAFGGKAATATQIIKTVDKMTKHNKKSQDNNQSNNNTTTRVYFGFAPIINFDSKKTCDVVRAVGLDRLVLETDHEDVQKVPASMAQGVKEISQALDVSPEQLIQATNKNVQDLYGIMLPEKKENRE